MMAAPTSSTSKRNSLHRLSNLFQLPSPSFSKSSFDSPRNRLVRNTLSPVKARYSQTTSVSSSVTLDSHDRESTLAPTSSIVSDSTLSASQVPLLDSGRAKSPDLALPVPPTTNELAAEEKAKLVKKARKISRVLGEVPIPSRTEEDHEIYSPKRLSDVPENPPSLNSRPTSPTLNVHIVSASAKKAFRKSLTSFVGAVPMEKVEVHRSKSTSALRPPLQVSSITLEDEDARPYSPIVFATNDALSDRSVALPEDALPSGNANNSAETLEDHVPSSPLPPLVRHDSSISSDLPVEETRERIQRQRMERLARILGNGVPPDVLRRAASPSAEDSSSSSVYRTTDGAKGMSMEHLPQRSSSLRAKISRRKRPQSLDFATIRSSGIISAPATPMEPPSALPAGVRRASSVQAKGSKSPLIEDRVLPQSSEPLTEKQRILNVKRAKKLTQVTSLLHAM